MTEINAPVSEAEKHQESVAVEEPSNNDQKNLNPETVTKIIKRETLKAYEKGKREAMMELQQQQAAAPDATQVQQTVAPVAQQQVPQQPNQMPSSVGGMPQMSPDQIKQMIMQHAPEAYAAQMQQNENKNLVSSFVSKMRVAEEKYPGLKQKLDELDFSTIAPLIKHIDRMENSGDIMNELVENPMKMGNLVSLIYSQPKLAEKAIHNLSASIKMNEDAKANEKSTQDPFGQNKPSINAGKDDGEMSVSDFQAMFKKKRR